MLVMAVVVDVVAHVVQQRRVRQDAPVLGVEPQPFGERVVVLTENLVGAALSSRNPNTGFAALFRSSSIASQLATLFDWDFSSGAWLTSGTPRPDRQLAPIPETVAYGEVYPAQLAVSPAATDWTISSAANCRWVTALGLARTL